MDRLCDPTLIVIICEGMVLIEYQTLGDRLRPRNLSCGLDGSPSMRNDAQGPFAILEFILEAGRYVPSTWHNRTLPNGSIHVHPSKALSLLDRRWSMRKNDRPTGLMASLLDNEPTRVFITAMLHPLVHQGFYDDTLCHLVVSRTVYV